MTVLIANWFNQTARLKQLGLNRMFRKAVIKNHLAKWVKELGVKTFK